MLEEKISTVKELNEQILSICNVGEIAKEIEDSDEIRSRAFDIKRSISQQIGTTPVPGAPRNTSPVVFEEFLPAASGLNQARPGSRQVLQLLNYHINKADRNCPSWFCQSFRATLLNFVPFGIVWRAP